MCYSFGTAKKCNILLPFFAIKIFQCRIRPQALPVQVKSLFICIPPNSGSYTSSYNRTKYTAPSYKIGTEERNCYKDTKTPGPGSFYLYNSDKLMRRGTIVMLGFVCNYFLGVIGARTRVHFVISIITLSSPKYILWTWIAL